MRVGFLHFHLKPGGVTNVIKQQVAQCQDLGYQTVTLCGENPQQLPGVVVLKDLKYSVDQPKGYRAPPPNDLADQILSCSRQGFQGHEPDLIHVHNPLLQKNDHLLPALVQIANQGIPLLFHIHDPSEDGRPDMLHEHEYPTNVHYAFLNSRDRQRFISAGVPKEYAHLLPNQVSELPSSSRALPVSQLFGPSIERYVTYPVRAIPRKNVLEALAVSLLVDDIGIAITLAPNNPADLPGYRSMVEFAQELKVPVEFEVGLHYDFGALLAGSAGIMTTSRKEGFGFAFLEPWTIQKPVFGRYIPGICEDFESNGIQLNFLYREFAIPIDSGLFSLSQFKAKWIQQWKKEFLAIQQHLGFNHIIEQGISQNYPHHKLDELLELEFLRIISSNSVDFSLLDLGSQSRVLRALKDLDTRSLVLHHNSQIQTLAPNLSRTQDLFQMLNENQQVVKQVYGIHEASKRLASLYKQVIQGVSKAFQIDRAGLLHQYLFPLGSPVWDRFDYREEV